MRQNIYSIFDSALGAYLRPFFAASDGVALRSFTDIATDAEHPIGQHPEHYTLVRIGTYEDENGNIVGEMVKTIATALEVASTHRANIKERLNEAVDLKEYQERNARKAGDK